MTHIISTRIFHSDNELTTGQMVAIAAFLLVTSLISTRKFWLPWVRKTFGRKEEE